MAWCIANDQTEAAVVYGHAAGETDTVAGLVDALALPLYYDGRMETLEEWLGWFSDEELARYPALAVYGAWFRVLTGRPAEAERWLALADGATSAIPLSDGSATIEPWVANLRACMMQDGVEQALADANRALDQFPPDSGWRPDRARDPRRCACAARRNRSRDRRPIGGGRGGACRRCRGGAVYVGTGTARAARGQAGSLGRGRATRTGGTSARRRGGPRRLRVERDRARGDRTCRTPRGETRGCSRGDHSRSPSAAAARSRHSLADRSRSGSSSPAPTSRSPKPPRPARS